MSAHTVMTHALNQGERVSVPAPVAPEGPHALTPGTRARYTGTQSWGPHAGAPLTDDQRTELYTVTVVKPWGGLANPLYVVQLTDGRTYVAGEAELSPVAPARGVSLVKDDGLAEWERELLAGTDSGRMIGGQLGTLPGWVSRGLYRNNPCHLSEAFARLAPKTLAPTGLPEGELSY